VFDLRNLCLSTLAAVSTVAVSSIANGLFSDSVRAQQADTDVLLGQAEELPEIVVDGASIAVEPSKKTKRKIKRTSVSSGSVASSGQNSTTSDGTATGVASVAGDSDGESDNTVEVSGEADSVPHATFQAAGTAVSVLTRQDLEQQQIRHAADALRSLPGVYVSRSGGVGHETVVRLRGAESNHTLVLIDGVEVNQGASGLFDFSNLTTEDIERIEVLRGPQSGLYGSNAVAGVINIITRSGEGPLKLTAIAEGGSFSSNAFGAQLSGGSRQFHGFLSAQRRKTNGFNLSPEGTEDDGSQITTLSGSVGFRPFEGLLIKGSLRQSTNEGERDGFDAFINNRNVSSDDLSSFQTRVRLGQVGAILETFDKAWLHEVRASYAETDTLDEDRGFFPRTFNGIDERRTWSYKTTLHLQSAALPGVRHTVTGLVEDQRQTFEQPSDSAFTFEKNRLSFAGELKGEYFDTVSLTGAVRHDDNDTFENFTSWRLAGALRIPTTGIKLHASVGTGVKDPSFGELFGQFSRFTPNPFLQPETSFGWDIGVEVTALQGRAVFDVTYFDSTLEDEISEQFTFNPATGFFDIVSVNLDGESQRKGVEVSARVLVFTGLTVGGSYTYLDATDPLGQEEVRRAPHTGRVDVNYGFADGRGNLNFAAHYNGRMLDNVFDLGVPPFGAVIPLALDDYWLATVAGSYEVAPGLKLFGRLENAFDTDYNEIFGRETAGLAAYAGIKIQLGGQGGLQPASP
jgi:vitamin B12 transporter